jgi:transcription elongation factor
MFDPGVGSVSTEIKGVTTFVENSKGKFQGQSKHISGALKRLHVTNV